MGLLTAEISIFNGRVLGGAGLLTCSLGAPAFFVVHSNLRFAVASVVPAPDIGASSFASEDPASPSSPAARGGPADIHPCTLNY